MPLTSPSPPWSRAVVVGASSGIGAAIVERLARDGVRTAAVARRQEELEKLAAAAAGVGRQAVVLPVVHDVRDVDGIPLVFERVCAALGGLDLIVYAAGVLPRLGPDQYDTAVDRETITVNFTGAVAWLNEAAARFSVAGSGTIVGIGSMAGERGRRGNPVYGATKAALATYLESLRNRLSTNGVRVVTAKPGFVDTPMTEGLAGMFWLVSADDAARQILEGAVRGASTVYVPPRWRPVGVVVRAIPSAVFRRLPV